MVAWVYCRVSTKEQAVDGASLPVQAREGKKHIRQHGWELGRESNYNNPGVFADPGVSAWKIPLFERPGFQSLWKCAKPGDSIVFQSLDRGFRSVKDFCVSHPVFDEHDINAVFIMDEIDMSTATGRLIAHIMAAFAQFKSDMIGQRRREAYAYGRSTKKCPWMIKATQAENPLLARLVKTPNAVPDEKGMAYEYIRVSTTSQETQAQINKVSAMKKTFLKAGYSDGARFTDHGVSAFCVNWADRPEGKKLWDQLKPGDCVLVSRVDRAFRSLHDMADTLKVMVEKGIHNMTGCGVSTQAVEILGLMAEWESRSISRRVRMAIAHQRELCGPWKSTWELPRFMKEVRHADNTWTAVVDRRMLEDYRDVYELTDMGMTRDQVSDYMEEREARRDGRPMVPRQKFDMRSRYGSAGRRGEPRPPNERAATAMEKSSACGRLFEFVMRCVTASVSSRY
jgi:DNA invertase Pin-like site-specific DNA recombinase